MNIDEEEAAWQELERKLKKLENIIGEVQQMAGIEPQPVAWRKRVNGIWHYFDESSPFPPDGCEELFLRNDK